MRSLRKKLFSRRKYVNEKADNPHTKIQGFNPDIVLLDVEMLGKGGYQKISSLIMSTE